MVRDLPAGPEALAPDVRAEPELHGRCRRGARAGHRRQHRDLLRGERGAPQAGSVPRSRPNRPVPQHLAQRLGPGRLARQVPALAPADDRCPGRHGLSLQRRQLHRRSVPRAAAPDPGVRRLLPPVRRASRPRPRVHGRRRSPERQSRRPDQPQPVDPSLQRRRGHHRQDAVARGRRLHGRRRGRRVVQRRGARRPAGFSGHRSRSIRTPPTRATISRWRAG